MPRLVLLEDLLVLQDLRDVFVSDFLEALVGDLHHIGLWVLWNFVFVERLHRVRCGLFDRGLIDLTSSDRATAIHLSDISQTRSLGNIHLRTPVLLNLTDFSRLNELNTLTSTRLRQYCLGFARRGSFRELDTCTDAQRCGLCTGVLQVFADLSLLIIDSLFLFYQYWNLTQEGLAMLWHFDRLNVLDLVLFSQSLLQDLIALVVVRGNFVSFLALLLSHTNFRPVPGEVVVH